MTVEFDLDGTLCTQVDGPYPDYALAVPYRDRIKCANRYYERGWHVRIKTGRGLTTGVDWRDVTEAQLECWGVMYHELKFRKDDADLRFDDKARRAEELDRCVDVS